MTRIRAGRAVPGLLAVLIAGLVGLTYYSYPREIHQAREGQGE
jgi:hypothetical protein